MRVVLVLLLFTISCAGLGAGVVGTPAWFESEKPALSRQAGFDLACPADQVQLTALSADHKTVGAQGCAKRTSYLFVFGTGWGRNSEVLTN